MNQGRINATRRLVSIKKIKMDISFVFFVDFSANLTRKKCNSDEQSSLDAHARFHYVLKHKHIVIET